MTVQWGAYEPHARLYERPVAALRRSAARNEFRHVLAVKWGRIEQLRRLLAGADIRLVADEAGIQALDDWYRTNAEWPAGPSMTGALWRSVAFDIGLFLGDALIARNPYLSWQLFTRDKRSPMYHKHVVMGDGSASTANRAVDIDALVTRYGQDPAPHHTPRGLFATVVESALYAV